MLMQEDLKGSCHVEPDGITFDVQSVTGERITEDADYDGVRQQLPSRKEQAS